MHNWQAKLKRGTHLSRACITLASLLLAAEIAPAMPPHHADPSQTALDDAEADGNSVVHLDLAGFFDLDTVLSPRDPPGPSGGIFDWCNTDRIHGFALVEDGWDGTAPNPQADGLPPDGIIEGVDEVEYWLGPYDGPNAIHICGREDAGVHTRIPVPPIRYREVRFLLASSVGDCDIPITAEYDTGAPQPALLLGDDWYDDGGNLRNPLEPVIDGMDRVRLDVFALEDSNDPALFSQAIALDSDRILTALVLRPGDAGTVWKNPNSTSMNIFAVNLFSYDDEGNELPVLDAIGADPAEATIFGAPVTISLTCEAHDPDESPLPLQYVWKVEDRPAGAVVAFTPSPPRQPLVTVTVDTAGSYQFTCSVSDGARFVAASVTVAVSCVNAAPQIELSLSSETTPPGTAIRADASGTYDPDEGPQPLQFLWTFRAEDDEAPIHRLELAEYWNLDAIYEPGGAPPGGGIDVYGNVFYVDGFNGSNEGDSSADGIPADGRIGPYQLAPFDGPNVLQLSPGSADLTVSVDPQVAGTRLVYLVTGGDGDSDLFLTIVYEDDTVQNAFMHCDDWFDDEPPTGLGGSLRTHLLTPVINKLDRGHPPHALGDESDPAIFKGEILLEAADRPVKEIRFHPTDPRSTWAESRCRLNLFGLWIAGGGVTIASPAAPETSITLGWTEGVYRFRLTVHDGDACTGPQSREFGVTVVAGAAAIRFKRGDANADGRMLEVTDAVFTLQYLFAAGPTPPCEDAADANDDNRPIDLGDALYILQYLFQDGPTIPPPFPECGLDETVDGLSCEAFVPCQ